MYYILLFQLHQLVELLELNYFSWEVSLIPAFLPEATPFSFAQTELNFKHPVLTKRLKQIKTLRFYPEHALL